jgi:alpha-amylase/alpha-mannosidase (GH57 family)
MSQGPALIIHGHFYQPPRDNPWTGIVEREPSAAPFHNWNERIWRECYRPNAHARIFDDLGAVEAIVNNYELLSFNFGPTLLAWLEQKHPQTYRRILHADRCSLRDRGHGNAIAQGYNHAILPLCNERDMRTQIRWGLTEFRHRFGRAAEALWLPETACNANVVDALIDEDLRFALLAPQQAARVRQGDKWTDVSGGRVDPRHPYLHAHSDGSGRSIALFFYDAGIARGVAFEGALSSSTALIDRFERAAGGEGSVVHAVTDGESYGHHFKFGDRCLAYALGREAKRRGMWVTNYGEFLDHHPPERWVELAAGDDGMGSSWSCAHGVGRWFRDCGCHTGGKAGYSQKWRTPLRDALDSLRDVAAEIYESRTGDLVDDPWALRDDYIELLLDPSADRARFFELRAKRALSGEEQQQLLQLLEMQRSSMLMYTSCGWFFNDLAGIETIQVMRYAGRLTDQLAALGRTGHEATLVEQLGEAHSNVSETGSGADIYRAHVAVSRVSNTSLAAHVSLTALPLDLPTEGELAGCRYELLSRREQRRGRLELATARVVLVELATGARSDFASCAIFFGGVDLHCLLRRYVDDAYYEAAVAQIWDEFESRSLLTLLRVAGEQLGPTDYGLSDVLPSERDSISRAMFSELKERYAIQYEAMYQDARRAIGQFHGAGLPLPHELRMAAQLALAYRFEEAIAIAPASRFEAAAYTRAIEIAREAARYGCELRLDTAGSHVTQLLSHLMRRVCAGDTDPTHSGAGGPTRAVLGLLEVSRALGLEPNLNRAQEQLFDALRASLQPSDIIAKLADELGLAPELLGN